MSTTKIKQVYFQRALLSILLAILFTQSVSINSNYSQKQLQEPEFSIYQSPNEEIIDSKPRTDSSINVLNASFQETRPIYQDEVSTFEFLEFTQILQNASSVEISASETTSNGTKFFLGNYNTTAFNFSSSELALIDYPTTFDVGISSNSSSFFLKFHTNNTYEFGLHLDWDDDYDYNFISFEIDEESNYYFLAQRTYIGLLPLTNLVDVSIFKYNSTLDLVNSTIFGSDGNEIFGLDDTSPDWQPFMDLLELDSQGNVIISGKSTFGAIHPSSEIQNWNPVDYTQTLTHDEILVVPDLKVALMWDGFVWGNTVASWLTSYTIDVTLINIASSTPSLATMNQYHVIAISSYSYQNGVLLGNRLADYVDGGGTLIVGVYSINSFQLPGRIHTDEYIPLYGGATSNAGRTYNGAGSGPLFTGVSSFGASFSQTVSARTGATVLGYYTDGMPMIAQKGNVIAWNFYYFPSGDYTQLAFNSFDYLADDVSGQTTDRDLVPIESYYLVLPIQAIGKHGKGSMQIYPLIRAIRGPLLRIPTIKLT